MACFLSHSAVTENRWKSQRLQQPSSRVFGPTRTSEIFLSLKRRTSSPSSLFLPLSCLNLLSCSLSFGVLSGEVPMLLNFLAKFCFLIPPFFPFLGTFSFVSVSTGITWGVVGFCCLSDHVPGRVASFVAALNPSPTKLVPVFLKYLLHLFLHFLLLTLSQSFYFQEAFPVLLLSGILYRIKLFFLYSLFLSSSNLSLTCSDTLSCSLPSNRSNIFRII